MWSMEVTTQYEHAAKWYAKKRPVELGAVLRNLSRYIEQLNIARNMVIVEAGYIHHEPHGVVAIDQKGSGKSLQETRLYTYPDMGQKVLYLITIGNKDEQPNDIAVCNEFVESIIKSQESK